jgi:Trypsin
MIKLKKIFLFLLAFVGINMIMMRVSLAIMPVDNGDPVESTDVAPYNSIVLVSFNGYICTGEFIQRNDSNRTSSNVVLTAGHCATAAPDEYRITSADGSTTYHVSRVITHYAGGVYDYALLVLEHGESSSHFLKLAPEGINRDFIVNSNPPQLEIAGYGIDLKTNVTDGTGNRNSSNPPALLKGTVTPTSDDLVESIIADAYEWIRLVARVRITDDSPPFKPEYMFATCSNQPADHGDSGGPVMYYDSGSGQYYLIGDTSWGLTIYYHDIYYSYDKCRDFKGANLSDSKLSIFTDLTYGSNSYKKLVNDLNTL